MNRLSLLWKLLIGIFVVALTASILVQHGEAQRKERLTIEITHPKTGAKVEKQMVVQGTARLPSGYHVWVLARRSDSRPLWVPQQEAEFDPQTNSWKATTVFGESEDIGRDYDVGVIAVDGKGHAALTDYTNRARNTGEWKPTEIPLGSSPPQIVTVKKVGH